MSYNIRGYVPCDALKKPSHHWYYRQQHIVDIIKKEMPDILGVQEIFNVPQKSVNICRGKKYVGGYDYDKLIFKDIVELSKKHINISPPKHLIRDFLRESLKRLGYSSFYKKGGSPKIIFYKNTRFKYVYGGKFYHNKENKKSTNFLFLQDLFSNTNLIIFNTHLISGKEKSTIRKKSIDRLVEFIHTINKDELPLVLMGDFNIRADSIEYVYLKESLKSIDLFPSFRDSQITFNGFGITTKKIDYIFYNKKLRKLYSTVSSLVYDINKSRLKEYQSNDKNILFPSDHWPIEVYFDFNSSMNELNYDFNFYNNIRSRQLKRFFSEDF